MPSELAFIEALRAIATHPAALGLKDDAAVLEVGGAKLVLTLDTLVEGVHYLSDDAPDDIAWKLVAVNASDLSAKGAIGVGCLLSYPLADDRWNAQFLVGLETACKHFGLPLLGGDTVRAPVGTPRSLSLTAIGSVAHNADVPSRTKASRGERVWVSGSIGDAGLGLAIRLGQASGPDDLVRSYLRPMPSPTLGPAIAPFVSAMMDVSDGLAIDASRMAKASGCSIVLDAGAVPLSPSFVETSGNSLDERLSAMTSGDDYCLLFTSSPENDAKLLDATQNSGIQLTPVGRVEVGEGLRIEYLGKEIDLPERLGFEH